MEKLTEKQVLMTGIDEGCEDESGNSLGHVGFHDYDGYIPKPELEAKVRELAIAVGTHVFVLKTGYGYHLVSFEILSPEKYLKWKLKCRELFPSDYKDDICEKCHEEMCILEGKYVCPNCDSEKLLVKRVLRISPKPSANNHAMRPQLLFSWFAFNENPLKLSKAHMDVYSDNTVYGAAILPNLYESLVETAELSDVEVEAVPTKVALCKYMTKAHLEE